MKDHKETTDRQHFAELFRDKSYWEANRSRYILAQSVSYLCNLISIATAFTLPYITLLNIIPDFPGQKVLAAIGSITALVALETAVRIEARAFFITALKSNWRKVTPWAIVTLVSLFSLSLYSSREGAAVIAELADNRQAERMQQFKADTAAIFAMYRSDIEQERKALEDYKRSVSWAGRIDVSNPATKKVIQQHTDRIGQLQSSMAIREQELSQAYWIDLSNLQTESERVKMLASSFAMLVVFTFMLSMWYLYYFGFRVVLEQQYQEPQRQAATPDRISATPNVSGIGFKIGTPRTDNAGRFEGYKIRCEQCGTETVKSRPAKFCSDKCRHDNYKAKNQKI